MHTDTPSKTPRRVGLAAGAAVATFDAALASALGVEFHVGGVDVTLGVWAYLVATLATLGYVIGRLIESRRAERAHAAALADARARLARNATLAALGQLAGTVAHEVRNPLAVIRSTVQTAREDLDDGLTTEATASLALALGEIDRLDRVIDGVLGLARPPGPARVPVPAAELLARVADLGARLVADRGLTLTLDPDPAAAPPLDADPDLATQALLDLVANAADAAPPDTAITLSAAPAPDGVALSVRDRGPGVPAELRGQIFEPFFTTRAQGTGLGLAVVRHIARAHGGRVELDDAPGGGARFTLILPAAPSQPRGAA